MSETSEATRQKEKVVTKRKQRHNLADKQREQRQAARKALKTTAVGPRGNKAGALKAAMKATMKAHIMKARHDQKSVQNAIRDEIEAIDEEGAKSTRLQHILDSEAYFLGFPMKILTLLMASRGGPGPCTQLPKACMARCPLWAR